MAQYFENLLVVNQVAGEAADQSYGFMAHRFDKVLRFVPMIEHVVRYAAAPNGMDGQSVGIVQGSAVEFQIAYIAHNAFVAVAREEGGEHLELVDHAAFKVVADGESGTRNKKL